MMYKTLGILELNSVAAGIEAGDAMMKTAFVRLEAAQATCPGKYVVLVSGDTSGVTSSIEAGSKVAGENEINQTVIPNLHEQVIPALASATMPSEQQEAVGVIETFSIVSAVFAADVAVKTANIELVEIRLGRGLAGKSFVTLCGGTAEVESAVKAAEKAEECQGMIFKTVVIPSLHEDMMKAIL